MIHHKEAPTTPKPKFNPPAMIVASKIYFMGTLENYNHLIRLKKGVIVKMPKENAESMAKEHNENLLCLSDLEVAFV